MKTNVTIRILENSFDLVCDINDTHLKAFRRSNPAIDSEKLILMGALRATCELVSEVDTLSDQAKVANGEMQKALNLLGSK